MIDKTKPEFYVEDDFQEIKLRVVNGKCFIKRKDRPEYEVSWDTNIVAQAILDGSKITKEQYYA